MRTPTPAQTTEVLILVGVLIALVMIAAVVLLVMRKRILGPQSEDQGSFLDDLRKARDRGEITSEEFDAMRARMIEKLRGSGSESAVALRPKKHNDATPDS